MNQAALKQYQAVGVQGGVTDASPHQLIGMLLTGALDRIASARGAATRGDVQRKGELLSRSIAIIDNLRASLDREKGGEIAANLSDLYDYMEQRLVEANLSADVEILDEVSALLLQIRAGWESIPAEYRSLQS
ncbi:flagellar export chaperone FliS [Pseudohalioglobus lutimaris]|uniref:Flagellar secretion chaperone FliS n=1 Tax=Pseudohalioglobus lutimaris TaxID=1737061 RepID=A0A2N5X1C7_9GAMM|nr:flagellar export chaperone FliS [Pseudohalioglobus lutimaris]PLW68288.1 flagellar export chaperone FliS [Pseudohalioglobus lutimaris]